MRRQRRHRKVRCSVVIGSHPKPKRDGIEIRTSDRTQPYRVWRHGVLIAFAKTKEDAKKIYLSSKQNPIK